MIDENEIKNKMSKVIDNLESRYTTIRAGRANPAILNKVKIDYLFSKNSLYFLYKLHSFFDKFEYKSI